MKNSNEFAHFIDNFRKSRNITREDFVDGIISLRQYYRFIKGDSSLKSESINSLLERLEINTIDLYGQFIKKKNESLKNLIDSYNLISLMEYDKAKVMLAKINESDLQSVQDIKFLRYLLASLNFHLKLESEEKSMNKIIEIIDYPKILNKDILTFYEITGLFSITTYLIRHKNDYRVAIFTYEVLNDPRKYYVNNMKSSINSFYASASKNLGIIGEIEKSLEMADKGIQEAKASGTITNLPILFYCKALSEYNLNMTSQYQKTLIRLFGLLNVQDDEKKSEFYKKLIVKQFDIKESDLIIYKKIKK